MKKTFEEINEKIKNGKAVVLTAEEVSSLAETMSADEIFKKVDVVTTATFAPMCSSGAFINFGHTTPPMRMEKVFLNDVEVYGGLAAVDVYIGATSESIKDPAYGGAHIIEALIKGEDIKLKARAKGTDCYPRKEIETFINIHDLNEAYLFNPRNIYQNYAAATNSTSQTKYTYMGILLPEFGNINYSTSGELSPLLNDPELETIGIGTRIFLCGATGYVSWYGTQFNTEKEVNEKGIPLQPARTLALIGNLKEMDPAYIKAAYFKNYGVSLFVGVGIPIPILNRNIAKKVMVRNREIETYIYDYGKVERPIVGKANYEELRSGIVILNGKKIKTSPISSLSVARKIAIELKNKIKSKNFYLTKPVEKLPEKLKTKTLKIRTTKKDYDRKIYFMANNTFNDENLKKPIYKGKLIFEYNKCIDCGACTGICSSGALKMSVFDNLIFDEEKCTECLKCIEACPLKLFKENDKNLKNNNLKSDHNVQCIQ